MTTQLSLGIQLTATATFANFVAGSDQQLVNHLQRVIAGEDKSYIYCWGKPGVGRSHLLQACCHAVGEQQRTALYLPLAQCLDLSPQALCEGLEQLDLVCLDDINSIAKRRYWEEAIFYLYNRLQAENIPLIIAANAPATQLDLTLPDLQSRLSAGVSYQIHELTDEQKLQALQLRATEQGLTLSDQVGNYLLHHYPRNMTALFTALTTLDQQSIQHQRRLTIPFVKQILFSDRAVEN